MDKDHSNDSTKDSSVTYHVEFPICSEDSLEKKNSINTTRGGKRHRSSFESNNENNGAVSMEDDLLLHKSKSVCTDKSKIKEEISQDSFTMSNLTGNAEPFLYNDDKEIEDFVKENIKEGTIEIEESNTTNSKDGYNLRNRNREKGGILYSTSKNNSKNNSKKKCKLLKIDKEIEEPIDKKIEKLTDPIIEKRNDTTIFFNEEVTNHCIQKVSFVESFLGTLEGAFSDDPLSSVNRNEECALKKENSMDLTKESIIDFTMKSSDDNVIGEYLQEELVSLQEVGVVAKENSLSYLEKEKLMYPTNKKESKNHNIQVHSRKDSFKKREYDMVPSSSIAIPVENELKKEIDVKYYQTMPLPMAEHLERVLNGFVEENPNNRTYDASISFPYEGPFGIPFRSAINFKSKKNKKRIELNKEKEKEPFEEKSNETQKILRPLSSLGASHKGRNCLDHVNNKQSMIDPCSSMKPNDVCYHTVSNINRTLPTKECLLNPIKDSIMQEVKDATSMPNLIGAKDIDDSVCKQKPRLNIFDDFLNGTVNKENTPQLIIDIFSNSIRKQKHEKPKEEECKESKQNHFPKLPEMHYGMFNDQITKNVDWCFHAFSDEIILFFYEEETSINVKISNIEKFSYFKEILEICKCHGKVHIDRHMNLKLSRILFSDNIIKYITKKNFMNIIGALDFYDYTYNRGFLQKLKDKIIAHDWLQSSRFLFRIFDQESLNCGILFNLIYTFLSKHEQFMKCFFSVVGGMFIREMYFWNKHKTLRMVHGMVNHIHLINPSCNSVLHLLEGFFIRGNERGMNRKWKEEKEEPSKKERKIKKSQTVCGSFFTLGNLENKEFQFPEGVTHRKIEKAQKDRKKKKTKCKYYATIGDKSNMDKGTNERSRYICNEEEQFKKEELIKICTNIFLPHRYYLKEEIHYGPKFTLIHKQKKRNKKSNLWNEEKIDLFVNKKKKEEETLVFSSDCSETSTEEYMDGIYCPVDSRLQKLRDLTYIYRDCYGPNEEYNYLRDLRNNAENNVELREHKKPRNLLDYSNSEYSSESVMDRTVERDEENDESNNNDLSIQTSEEEEYSTDPTNNENHDNETSSDIIREDFTSLCAPPFFSPKCLPQIELQLFFLHRHESQNNAPISLCFDRNTPSKFMSTLEFLYRIGFRVVTKENRYNIFNCFDVSMRMKVHDIVISDVQHKLSKKENLHAFFPICTHTPAQFGFKILNDFQKEFKKHKERYENRQLKKLCHADVSNQNIKHEDFFRNISSSEKKDYTNFQNIYMSTVQPYTAGKEAGGRVKNKLGEKNDTSKNPFTKLSSSLKPEDCFFDLCIHIYPFRSLFLYILCKVLFTTPNLRFVDFLARSLSRKVREWLVVMLLPNLIQKCICQIAYPLMITRSIFKLPSTFYSAFLVIGPLDTKIEKMILYSKYSTPHQKEICPFLFCTVWLNSCDYKIDAWISRKINEILFSFPYATFMISKYLQSFILYLQLFQTCLNVEDMYLSKAHLYASLMNNLSFVHESLINVFYSSSLQIKDSS